MIKFKNIPPTFPPINIPKNWALEKIPIAVPFVSTGVDFEI